MSLVEELAQSVSPEARRTPSRACEVVIGLRNADVGLVLAQALRALDVDAEMDAGMRGFPATVHALVPARARVAARQVLELAHFLDPSSMRLSLRGAPRESVRQVAPRVASRGAVPCA